MNLSTSSLFNQVGIFTEEIPFQFAQIVGNSLWNNLLECYNIVHEKYSIINEIFNEQYEKCIDVIKDWTIQLKEDEIQQLKIQYPYIQYIYEYTY